MAITLRTLKGTALTYEEVDRNFSQYFYSASIDGENLKLWYTGSDALDLPGSDYGPRVGATIPLSVGTTGPGGSTSAGIRDGNIQYKVGTGFGGGDGFHYDYSTKRVGIGTVVPAVQLDIAASLNNPAKLRLSAVSSTTVNEGNKAWIEFFKGTTNQAQVGLLKSDALFYINTPTGNKLQIAEKTKAYITSTGLGVTNGDFTTIPNQALTVVGKIGIGDGTTDVDQSTVGQGTVLKALLPTSANTAALLLESQKGTSGGNIIMGLNSTANNNEAFSIVRGLRGTYDRTVATFKADGKVGIGVVNPTQKLDVNGKVRTSGIVLPSDAAYYDIGSLAAGSTIRIGVNGSTTDRNLYFGANDNNGVFHRQISLINSTGNLGVGTDNPGTYRLYVNGTTNLQGATNIVGVTNITGATNTVGDTSITGNLSVTGNIVMRAFQGLNFQTTGQYSTNFTPLASPNLSVAANANLFYPIVGGKSVVTGQGYVNDFSFGMVRDINANGYGAIRFAGDGISTPAPMWKFYGNGTLSATNFTGELTGNAATVTNGVYTVGTQTIGGTKTFSGVVYLSDGGFMFNSDGAKDTGITWASDGVMNVRSNGVTIGQFNSTEFTGNAATATNATNATYAPYQPRSTEGALTTSFTNTPPGNASWHDGNNETGAPTPGEWWNIHNMRHSNPASVYGTQQAYKWGGGVADMYIRQVNSNSFEAWARVFTTANYNSYSPTLTGTGASGTWNINITGTAGAVAWNNVTSKPSSIFYYQGFQLNANTMDTNASGFTYANNAPFNGPIMRIGEGGYSLQLNASYNGGGNQIAFRTRNGDASGIFNPWRELLSSGNHKSFGTVPKGGIIMWSGAVASIPGGWALCNGGNGTPDLRDRFVIGAGASYSPGEFGGFADAVVVSHTHNAYTTISPNPHSHTIALDSSAGRQDLTTLNTGYSNTARSDEEYVGANLIENVALYASTGLSATGVSGGGRNLPPYYALAYIMFVG